jgi:CRP-like cAMP-binding protein
MKTINQDDRDFICDIDSPCFRMLSPHETSLIQGSKTQVLFRKGDHLSKQGTFSSYILFIIKGIAKKYIEGDQGRDFNLRLVNQGNFVGLSAVFTKNTFSYSAVAITDCQAIIVENEAITKLIEQNGLFGLGIIKRYFEEYSKLYSTLNTIVFKQMNGRMAETLLYIDSLKGEDNEIFSLLSRRDLAEFTGITTESTVKLLKSFEKDGLISLNEKAIQIKNPDGLKELARLG